MKKVFQVVVFSMLAAVFNMSYSSCSSDDYSSPIKGKTVSDVTFESSQSTHSITIGDADLTGFTITSSETWCVATAQGKNLNITVQPNTTYSERQATITVTDPGDQSVVSFKILQKQNDAILIDGKTFNVPEAGGDVTIKVQSNVNYQVEIPSSASWLTSKAATRALENSTIVLSATANNSGDEREATIKLTNTASGVSSEFTVKQDLTPAVSIDFDEVQVDEYGGEIEVTVTSNIAIDVKYSDSWVSNAGTTEKGGFGFVQKIKVSPLPSDLDNRTAKVEFSDKLGKWNVSKEVTIKQTKSLAIKDSDVEILIGKSYTLEVINNTGSSLSWKSSNTSVATVNNNGKVTGVSKGTATITVTTADGKYNAQCTVKIIDITGLITAKPGGGSIMMLNDLIQYGSKLGWFFINNSPEPVKLKSMQLVDGVNGSEGNIMSVDTNVAAGESVGYTTTIGLLGIHVPVTCRFRYEYNGKEYMTTAVYNSPSW